MYDSEGKVTAYHKDGVLWMRNEPKDNDKIYEHPVLPVHPRSGNYMSKRWTLLEKMPTGPSVYHCLFRITPTD